MIRNGSYLKMGKHAWLWASLFFAVIFIANIASSQGESTAQVLPVSADVVRARQINIVDESGNVQAVVGAKAGASGGIFVPSPHDFRAALATDSDGLPMIIITSKDYQSNCSLRAIPSAQFAGLDIVTKDSRITLHSGPKVNGFVATRKATKEEVALTIEPGRPPGVHFTMKDKKGRTASLP